jgi:uncharacterized protein (TIGR03437 family)
MPSDTYRLWELNAVSDRVGAGGATGRQPKSRFVVRNNPFRKREIPCPGNTIMLYGVGFGSVTPNIPAGQIVTQSNALQSTFQASFAGTPATLSFAGLVGNFVGLYQFNVIVPNVAASDTVPFTFSFLISH